MRKMKEFFSIRRICAAALATVLMFSLLPVTTRAEDRTTVKGEPVTVPVNGDGYANRENNINKGWKFYLGTSFNDYQ